MLLSGILLFCSLLCGTTTIAISCSAVTVNAANATAEDCSELRGSLVNITCSRLQDVLKSISENNTSSSTEVDNTSACIEIRILPGHYVLTSNFTFVGQNIKLLGETENGSHEPTISFSLSDRIDPTTTHSPFYVLSFVNSILVEIRGISFLNSPGIITAHNVQSVLVDNCSFRYFFQGAVDLYNCHFVIVRDSIFEHNGPTSVVKSEPYRGHSGGLSIGYYKLEVEGGPRALVSNCTFRNNTSDPNSVAVQSTSDLFERFAFTGRGGGCAFTISPSTSLRAVVEYSTVEGNFARSFGGGLYVGFDGNLNHTVIVDRVQLIKNECPGAAGGLEIGFVQGADPVSTNQIIVLNSEFIENRASFGAGIYYFSPGPTGPDGRLSNFGMFQNCTFIGNIAREYGAAIGAITLLYFQDMDNLLPIEVDSCIFEGNDGGGGGVLSTAYVPLKFSGNSFFSRNRGRTLVVIGAYVEIKGGMHFLENNGAGIDAGAMYITSLGQLELFMGANITFTGNTGLIGAAVVIDALPVPPVYSRLIRNPLCTLLYEDSSHSPNDWDNVSIRFSENTAIIASSVYLNNLDLCSWAQEQSPWFQPDGVFKWMFVEYSDTNRNTAHDPDGYNQDWSVQTSAVDIQITSNVTVAYPGEHIMLGIKALDEIERSTSDIIRLSDLSDNAYLFEPSAITLSNIALGAVNISYLSPTKDIDFTSSRQIQVESLLGSTTFANAELQSKKCLPGYVLSILHDSYRTCQCEISNPSILECRGVDILLKIGLWGVADTSDTHDTVAMYPCPSGYCRCIPIIEGNSIQCHSVFRSIDPDFQCSCDRSGDLCGECKDGKGVSALLNRCTTCSDISGLLIALLLALDAAVFVVLLVFMKPLPSWIYPCVFYIQILPYLTEHFPTTFEQIQPALYYISSALSFYFVYDFCLYSNMKPLVSYFIRYLPLFLAIIVVCTWFALMNRFRKKTLKWDGLWWIVLLMYTHVIHTSMSILNCPILPGKDGSHNPRWYVSGQVKCFSSDHASLGLLAILILVLCVAVIPLSLAYTMEWVKHPRILKRVFEPLVLPFKQKYKWWASVEMSRRILLVLFIISMPQDKYLTTIVLMIIMTVYGFIQPYNEITTNVLEVTFSINVIILLLLRNTRTVEDALGMPSNINYSNNTSECTDNPSINITAFTWILFPLYYSSLFITCFVAIVWITIKIRSKVSTKWSTQRKTVTSHEDTLHNSAFSQKSVPKISTTEVVMSLETSPEGSQEVYREMVNSGDFADTVIIDNNS